MSIYDDPLIAYNGQPTDAFFNQMNAKVDELHGLLGLNAGPSAADIAAAVLAMAQITPIYSDVRKVNGDTIIGHGIPPTYDNTGTMTTPGDPWRPA